MVEAGLQILYTGPRTLRPEAIPLCTGTYLTGLMEVSYQIVDQLESGGAVEPTAPEWREAIRDMMEDSKRGGEYYRNLLSLLAQKPFNHPNKLDDGVSGNGLKQGKI